MKTNLYVGGCSWAWGDELQDPDKSAWPVLLAARHGLNLLHKGACGSSNESIWLGVMGLLTNKKWDGIEINFQELIVVLQWSFPTRSIITLNRSVLNPKLRDEIPTEYLDFPVAPGLTGRRFYTNKVFADRPQYWKKRWEQWEHEEFNAESLSRKTLYYIKTSLALLERHGIRYLSTWGPVTVEFPYLTEHSYWIENEDLDAYNHTPISSSFAEYIKTFGDCILGPDVHPLEKGHERWAERIEGMLGL